MDGEAQQHASPPGYLPSEEPYEGHEVAGVAGGSGTGAGTGEGADPPPDPTIDAAGDRFGGGTGGGMYTGEQQGSSEADNKEDGEEQAEQGGASGSSLASDPHTKALIMEIQAGVREVLREQHAAYLAKIDRGVLLQEDVLDRLRAIQRRLDTSPITNTAALDVPAAKIKTARPQLAALAPTKQDSGDEQFTACTASEPVRCPRCHRCGGCGDLEVSPQWRMNSTSNAAPSNVARDPPPHNPAPHKSIFALRPKKEKSSKKDKKDVYISDIDSQINSSSEGEEEEEDDEVAYQRATAASTKSGKERRVYPTDCVPLEKLAVDLRMKRGLPSADMPRMPKSLVADKLSRRSDWQDTLASGKNVRTSLAEVKDVAAAAPKDKIKKEKDARASLIMPPEATADVGGDENEHRKSNFSHRFHSFSVVPSQQATPGDERDNHSEEEQEEEEELSEDGTPKRATKKKKKPKQRKPARRMAGAGAMRHAGWDIPLPSMRDKEYSFWQKITKHPIFDFASGALIVASTVIAGTETNYMAQHLGTTTHTYYIVKLFFLACFLLELTLRMLGAGPYAFFLQKDRGWNIFDFIMVSASIFEFIVQLAQGDDGTSASGGGQGRILRILRIVRISRALRLGRVLRYARTFRQIVYSLQSSIVTLFWAMVMIFLVVYCFAVCFCQAWTEWVSDPVGIPMSNRDSKELGLLYSSLGRSLYSLFMAMTGGRSWGELLTPLMAISEMYTTLFVLFICLTYFGVLNVVAAIFVDSAMQSQQHYKDLLIQENVEKKEVYSQHLREVFFEIDRDGSGHINGDEMEFFLADPSLNLYLESIDIFPNDARSLFRLLDRDGSGEVSIEEFCQGCLRLKGEAKSFDIHCLIYANDRSQRKLDQIINWLTQAVPLD